MSEQDDFDRLVALARIKVERARIKTEEEFARRNANSQADETRIRAALRHTSKSPSLAATRHAGLARIEPLSAEAGEWLRRYASDEASWDGKALVVEMPYFPFLVDQAIDAGLTFESDESLH